VEDLKNVISKNLTELRKQNGMTQLELAEKLNYSDKAVSKWERAESLPDVIVLKSVADLFNVSVDYLLESVHPKPHAEAEELAPHHRKRTAHAFIICMSVMLVWLIGTTAFVLLGIVAEKMGTLWLSFIYCVPVSFLVWFILNSIWFGGKLNLLLVSALMWTALASIHITLVTVGYNVWLLYILGIPGQAIIITWATLKWKLKRGKKVDRS